MFGISCKFVGIVCLCFGVLSCTLERELTYRYGQFELGTPFMDKMVLQQMAQVAIFGQGVPHTQIEINASWGKSASTQVDTYGKWLTHIQTPKAGGPYSLAIKSQNTITLQDVLIGEVWLASGQSNMEWRLSNTNEFEKTMTNLDCDRIRLFTLQRNPQIEPQLNADAQWEACNAESLPNFSAVAYHFADKLEQTLDVPIGIMNASYGGTIIDPWTPLTAFESDSQAASTAKKQTNTTIAAHRKLLSEGASIAALQRNLRRGTSFLYNGMIHPLKPYTIKGFLWYQGESNRADGKHYGPKFVRMIKAWRNEWMNSTKPQNPLLPFYFVQIAPHAYSEIESRGVSTPLLLPILRDAQASALSQPNTAMVVISDHGDKTDIHPRNKAVVGERLAMQALNYVYQKPILSNSPSLAKFSFKNGRAYVDFDFADGLHASDNKALTWFELAGQDKKFYKAKATIDNNRVIVSSENVLSPLAIRFAWHEMANPNLVNQAGLPAIGFRTDDWPIADLPNRAK